MYSFPGRLNMHAETLLIILLRLTAGVLLLALVPLFFPHSLMAAINRDIGLGVLPDTAIIGYLTRSLSALYAFHGALLLYLSHDVRRWLPMIICFAALSMAFGGLMLVLDIYLRMPLPWILCEGPLIISIYSLIFRLAISVKRLQCTPHAPREGSASRRA
jgi:hypothetical protein